MGRRIDLEPMDNYFLFLRESPARAHGERMLRRKTKVNCSYFLKLKTVVFNFYATLKFIASTL